MKMLTARVPDGLLKESATACSSNTSRYLQPYFLMKNYMYLEISLGTWSPVFQPSMLMLCFNCANIWINGNRTLDCFYFYFDFIIYFWIQPNCFFIFMVSSQSKYGLEIKERRFPFFCLLKWWSIFSRTFVYDTHTLEVVSDGIEFKMWIQYFECVFIIIILQ